MLKSLTIVIFVFCAAHFCIGVAQIDVLQTDKLDKVGTDKSSKDDIKHEDKGDVIFVFEDGKLVLRDLHLLPSRAPSNPQATTSLPQTTTLPPQTTAPASSPPPAPSAPLELALQTTTDSPDPASPTSPHERERRESEIQPAANWSSVDLWPNKRIPFRFDITLGTGYRTRSREAMGLWESSICLTFEDARFTDDDYLIFKEGNSCGSYLGRKGGAQTILLDHTCSEVGEIAHQLGYAIGLLDEHTRHDRDDYIQIIYENIERDQDRAYFEKREFQLVPEVEYDIQSIMHPGPDVLGSIVSGERRQTIQIKDDADLEELQCSNLLPMGQREVISYKDKLRVAYLYGCNVHDIEPMACIPTEDETTSAPPPSPEVTTPTPIHPTHPPPPSNPRLLSGNVIQLTLNKGGYILACSSECRVQPNNHTHSNLFQILNHPNISSQKIRSGNVVLFQSLRDESTWLDCSNPRNCVLSRCENLPGGDDNIAVSSDCQKHQFEIIGVNRKIGKLLNARNKFRLRHPSSGKYLNCDANNISDGGGIGTGRCTLLQLEGESQDCLPHENSDASETSADRCDGKGFDFTANKKN